MVFETFHNSLPIPLLNFIHRYTPNARWAALRKSKADMDAILLTALEARKVQLANGEQDVEKPKDMLSALRKFPLAIALSPYRFPQ